MQWVEGVQSCPQTWIETAELVSISKSNLEGQISNRCSFILKTFFFLGWNDSPQRLGSLQWLWAIAQGAWPRQGCGVTWRDRQTYYTAGLLIWDSPGASWHFLTLFFITHSCSPDGLLQPWSSSSTWNLSLRMEFLTPTWLCLLSISAGQPATLTPLKLGNWEAHVSNHKKCEVNNLIRLPMEESENWYWKGVWTESQETWVLIWAWPLISCVILRESFKFPHL